MYMMYALYRRNILTSCLYIYAHALKSICICVCIIHIPLFFPHGEQVVKHLQAYHCAHVLLHLVYQAESSAKAKGAI